MTNNRNADLILEAVIFITRLDYTETPWNISQDIKQVGGKLSYTNTEIKNEEN